MKQSVIPASVRTAAVIFAIDLAIGLQAGAALVGFNQDIKNSTGQPAYDFHLSGMLESMSQPYQVSEYVTPASGWTYTGGTIEHIGAQYWQYQGGWAGTNPVPDGGTIHVGKYFEEDGYNVFTHLKGYWTDEYGNKINPQAVSDVPFVGFDVNDLDRTLTLENATTETIWLQNLRVATTSTRPELSELTADSSFLTTQSWITVSITSLSSGGTQVVDLASLGVTLNQGEYLLLAGDQSFTQGYSNNYNFFADIHGIPEPSTVMLVGLSLAGLLSVIRRKI